jgi:ketosteroid isomerase-like protein
MGMGARKKTTAKKPAKKPVATTARGAAKKPVKKAAAAAPKKKAAAKAPSRRPTPTEEVSKRIVAAMDDEKTLDLGKFYTEDAVSIEPGGGTFTGLQALRSKLAGWLAGLKSSRWTARHVGVSGHAIIIEWEADLVMKDGRQVKLSEVAVHELRGDKICAERFYYDPRALMPPPAPTRTEPPKPPKPAPPRAGSEEGSSVDPMDL